MATHSSNIIVKFTDDTVVIGLISNNNEIAYLDEVEVLSARSAEFLNLLHCFNLRQHVSGPTHDCGHTLDLIITDDECGNIQIMDLGISDHKAVVMDPAVCCPYNPKSFDLI
ncbi:hypothetical protein SKAU_G00082760 [Synaphobranchus kaupii]|uniref:Uncharacterized protein n=1 Tax=Synaphobranchus kaupii TaxID=118154 RepID=A0A9Q1FVZ0_SYNKA|nr:hypothetical protein SKAU_G00082760 [Synaphobranchus kaupii]